MTSSFGGPLTVNAEMPPGGPGGISESQTQMALTSSGMPGPNVVDTAPFWM